MSKVNEHGETPKRLQPTEATLKTLYLKSGNKCAFPGCNLSMFKSERLIGQVCHIEDAMPGGRWNPKKSNEDNRLESNLLLMCYAHHIETNDIEMYNALTLRGFKETHEEIVEKNITPTSIIIKGDSNVKISDSTMKGGAKLEIEGSNNVDINNSLIDGER